MHGEDILIASYWQKGSYTVDHYFQMFVQGDDFENKTRNYWCPVDMYYNDMGTLMFNSQETVIKQLFHLNGIL